MIQYIVSCSDAQLLLYLHVCTQVHGVSKSGKEFGVEVVVTSFVIDKEIYYTGIITETDKGLTRQMSASSLNSEAEIKEKQQKVKQLSHNKPL